jgi:hypothetical protein
MEKEDFWFESQICVSHDHPYAQQAETVAQKLESS